MINKLAIISVCVGEKTGKAAMKLSVAGKSYHSHMPLNDQREL